MSITELEDMAGISEDDKEACPFADGGDCFNCRFHIDPVDCEQIYAEWLLNKIDTEVAG